VCRDDRPPGHHSYGTAPGQTDALGTA